VRQMVAEAEHSIGHEGRIVVRLSGTESVARVMVEGPEENLIASLAHRIGQAIIHALDGSADDESPTLAKE
jgi:phosphoglucosamine mutase